MTTYKLSIIGILVCILGSFQSCIENDIPYPTIKGEILEIDMDGMISAKIDDDANTVMVKVADTLDLVDIRIKKLVVTEGAKVIPDALSCIDFAHFPDTGFVSVDSLPVTANTRMNFKKPVPLLLKIYQDYQWTINVSHEINRIFQVKNQTGTPLVDELNKQVIIYVDKDEQPKFDNIEIENMQLGSSIAETNPNPVTVHDFRRPQKFEVKAFGETEIWTVSIMHPSDDEKSAQLSVWTKRAYLSGTTKTKQVSAQYRKKGEDSWESVLPNEITIEENGSFLAMMTHLQPETTYEYELTVDGKTEGLKEFTTDAIQQVPNLNFDSWFLEGKVWYPDIDLSADNYFWDTGNKGASLAGGSDLPTMEEKKNVIKGSAIKMASKYVIIKFAAGNIYSGSFVGLAGGTKGAELDFGRPYTGRPSRMKGYYSYAPGIIDKADNDKYGYMKGQKDSCHIYIGLFNWTKPFRVNTVTETFVDLTWNNESMIAFGELKTDQSTSGYQSFNIELKYRDYFTKPTYIVIVASASKYGDYFVGSTSSVLYLDECKLVFE